MKQYAAHLMKVGANVLRGYDAYIYEFSKVRQVSLLRRLALRYPRARVINHASQAPSTAEWLTFPSSFQIPTSWGSPPVAR